MSKINVQNIEIGYQVVDDQDYICLTDMAKQKDGRIEIIIQNWMRNRMTIEFLGLWEKINNPKFNHIEFDVFRSKAGLNSFYLTPTQWMEKTNAIGIITKKGRYGGTYAHRDIAFEFASAISPVFKLYLIKEFQRLKEEADILNVALFGFTAKAWREANPELAKKNNVRDFATINELTVLSNLESHNAQMLREGKEKGERFKILQEIAEYQLNVLNAAEEIKMIESDGALSEV